MSACGEAIIDFEEPVETQTLRAPATCRQMDLQLFSKNPETSKLSILMRSSWDTPDLPLPPVWGSYELWAFFQPCDRHLARLGLCGVSWKCHKYSLVGLISKSSETLFGQIDPWGYSVCCWSSSNNINSIMFLKLQFVINPNTATSYIVSLGHVWKYLRNLILNSIRLHFQMLQLPKAPLNARQVMALLVTSPWELIYQEKVASK